MVSAAGRNEVIDGLIASVEQLNELCADKIDHLAQDDPEAVMHRHHRQAYMNALRVMEAERSDPIAFPGVRAERLQNHILQVGIGYLSSGGKWPYEGEPNPSWRAETLLFLEWMQAQVKANAEARASTLPI